MAWDYGGDLRWLRLWPDAWSTECCWVAAREPVLLLLRCLLLTGARRLELRRTVPADCPDQLDLCAVEELMTARPAAGLSLAEMATGE